MQDGSITFNTALDNKELERELTGLKKKIQSISDKIFLNQQQKLPLLHQSEELAIKLDEAKAKLYEMQTAPKQTVNSSAVKEQSEYVRGLQSEYDKVNNRIDAIDRNIKKSNTELSMSEEKAGAIEKKFAAASSGAKKLGNAVSHISPAMSAMNKKMDQFVSRITGLVKQVLVFSLITSALNKVRIWLGDVIKANDEASAAMARLRGALLTMAQPIVNFVVPAFTLLCDVLTRVITLVSKLLFSIFGGSFSAAKKSAEALNKEQKAIGGVGRAAKEASKYLAGFDELNVISDNTRSGGGASAGASSPNFDFDTGLVTQKLDEIAVYVAGALLALGAVLTFTGANIPLGLGLMAIGALTLAAEIKENWNAMDDGVRNAINNVLLILGIAGLVIGALLTFSGANVPLGIGLMVVGAAALATEAALNWDMISTALQGPIGIVTALVSVAFLALGAILAFTGAALPLGIGLMVVGAMGLTATVAVNWDTIITALQGPIGVITGIVSAALLVLGVILLFTGAGIPLGLGLIAAGAAGLVAAIAPNWNAITDKLKEVWQNVKNWWNSSVAPKFTVAFWKEKFSAIGKGLKDRIKDAVNGAIALFNKFIDWINDKMHFSWKGINIAGKQIVSGGSVQLFTIPKIPYLAQGAVIPPNREFMAVLGDQRHGTNVEAPLSTIQEAVALVMDDYAAANLAGHEATVAVLKDILEAVLGIEIGDQVIGQAAQRYNARMAITRGNT